MIEARLCDCGVPIDLCSGRCSLPDFSGWLKDIGESLKALSQRALSRDRNAKRHDREAGHGPKDESAKKLQEPKSTTHHKGHR